VITSEESFWLWAYYSAYAVVALTVLFTNTRSLKKDSGDYVPDMMDFIIVHVWAALWPVAWGIELVVWLVRKYLKIWRILAGRS
jgi:hypothetical protein